ncbi:MAG: hypothetical protein ABR905_05945 [Terracidiphilus sp.]
MQKTLRSQASFDGLDQETGREESNSALEETASLRGDDLRRLAWRGIKLSNTFLWRWLNLCEVGVEEIFFALTMLRPFGGVNLDPLTAPQGTAALDSRRLTEEHSFLGDSNFRDSSERHPEPAISWRTPWLYFVLFLLVWLLLF